MVKHWESRDCQDALDNLSSLSPIPDKRPGKNNYINLNFTGRVNVGKIIEYIYQIRCNLFHGGKDLNNPDDEKLVFNAGILLKKVLDIWLL
jgi:hypothetical protein